MWEEWTAPAEITAADIREDFNTESHCLWEMLQQSPLWNQTIAAIKQDGSENEIDSAFESLIKLSRAKKQKTDSRMKAHALTKQPANSKNHD